MQALPWISYVLHALPLIHLGLPCHRQAPRCPSDHVKVTLEDLRRCAFDYAGWPSVQEENHFSFESAAPRGVDRYPGAIDGLAAGRDEIIRFIPICRDVRRPCEMICGFQPRKGQFMYSALPQRDAPVQFW